MIHRFRAWNKIVERHQLFSLQDIERFKGEIQWHIIEIDQCTGKKDINDNFIYENDFFRVNHDEDNFDYCIVTWIKEWCMFATLLSGEYLNYMDNGVKVLDKTMYWTFHLHDSENEIQIIGNIRDKRFKDKLTGYIFI